MTDEALDVIWRKMFRGDCFCDAEIKKAIKEAYAIGFKAGAESMAGCAWSINDNDGAFDTTCGNRYILIDGTPADNGMKHCCYCGGKLSALPTDGSVTESPSSS